MADRTFEELLADGASAPVDGWDFSWFQGRASEQRPSWGYSRLLTDRLSRAGAALDVQTGGGEVLAEALTRTARRPATVVATEGWPPNVALAAQRLHRHGAAVVAVTDRDGLPFRAGAFDLVASRHPAVLDWKESARVLASGGTYLAQHVGAGSHRRLVEFLTGATAAPEVDHHEQAVAGAAAAGLTVVDLRHETIQTVFHDVGAVVAFLRKVVWTLPDFSIARYRPRLAALHEHIRAEGAFTSYTHRVLVEARKP